MPAHLVADPDTAPRTLDAATEAGWLALSAAMSDHAPDIADRDDLIVTVAPGAGHGAPACFLPDHAAIEIDGVHLGPTDPATCAPHHPGDRARYAPTWGLLTHECAHARHSGWTTPPALRGTPAAEAAELLEESRIEAAHIRRRPADRHWLRASARAIILADTRAADPAYAPGMTPAEAAHAAALLLGRVDAGILTAAETRPVADTATAVLGADTLAELRALWQAAHRLADDDDETMLELGRRWCQSLGIDPDHTPAEPAPTEPAHAEPGEPPVAELSPLAEAIGEALAAVAAAVAAEPVPVDPAAQALADAAAARAARAAATRRAARAARLVFEHGGKPIGETQIGPSRPATDAEKSAARRLAAALSTAAVRDRTATRTTSPVPPGRLRMRGVMAVTAQRAAGAIPTAEPFTRTTRRTVPTPPLRLGIACDVSGSMWKFTGPVASAAWILARAAALAPIPAQTATVIYGKTVRPITRPDTPPALVTEFYADDDWEDVHTAIDALDHTLALSTPGAARLLVIVSDGQYRAELRRAGQQRVTALRAAGCGVLWLAPDTAATPLHGATVHLLDDPTATATAIGRAATAALRAAQ